MDNKETAQLEKTTQIIQLVKGEFTPSEATHVLMGLINEKINFHKIQRLQIWEGNHESKTEQLDGRIKALEMEKKKIQEILNLSRGLGQNLKIKGVLEITVN